MAIYVCAACGRFVKKKDLKRTGSWENPIWVCKDGCPKKEKKRKAKVEEDQHDLSGAAKESEI